MYRALGNSGGEQWLQAWSQHEFAGWIWANPTTAAIKMGRCPFSGWIGNQKVFGPYDEANKALHPALGIPPFYTGYEWFQVWSKPQLWGGEITPEWIGWIYTRPTFPNVGSTKAQAKTFLCPNKITLVRHATGQTVT